jgi:hypothetical protein
MDKMLALEANELDMVLQYPAATALTVGTVAVRLLLSQLLLALVLVSPHFTCYRLLLPTTMAFRKPKLWEARLCIRPVVAVKGLQEVLAYGCRWSV